jgi:hypothetical protein
MASLRTPKKLPREIWTIADLYQECAAPRSLKESGATA